MEWIELSNGSFVNLAQVQYASFCTATDGSLVVYLCGQGSSDDASCIHDAVDIEKIRQRLKKLSEPLAARR